MSLIQLSGASVVFPVRQHAGVTLKEFIVRGLFRDRGQRRKSVQALCDVSLRVEDGARVGIIGYNGAGKSTLLRTIGGVYPVAAGSCRVSGTVSGLYDITYGFEPEATGWQNIHYRLYLQGETPRAVKAKLREIADFCELGSFLDLPVRCYSSGMVMRLAFAIATSSEPDILLIDEVFSTGDLAFQTKAQERIRNLMNRANIVVMVGHDLHLIEEFCTRVAWLDRGEVRMYGPPAHVLNCYKADARSREAA